MPGREYSYRSENGRRVVVNSVDTRAVLPEKEHAAQHKTVHDALVGSEGLEGLPETNTNSTLLIFKSLINSNHLFRDVNIVGFQLADPAEVLHCLAATVFQEQPAGRFLHPQRTNEKQPRRDELNGEGDDPLFVVLRHMLLHTVLIFPG